MTQFDGQINISANESARLKFWRRVRVLLAVLIIFGVIPVLALSLLIVDARYYSLIVSVVSLFALVPFFLFIENKSMPLFKLVPVAVLTAVAVAGRAAFFFTPGFKPIAAVIIIAGIVLGAPSGFLCGALSMLVSNFMFGQGPWTPMQMLGMGLVGFISGFLGKTKIGKSTVFLCVWGFIATLFYGFIADTFSALSLGGGAEWTDIIKVYIAGLVFNLVFAAATVIFLAVCAKPLIRKIERIKGKYGDF